MTYFVTTAQGAVYLLDSSGLGTALNKENLAGKTFLPVKTVIGEKVYVNLAHVVSIQPATAKASQGGAGVTVKHE